MKCRKHCIVIFIYLTFIHKSYEENVEYGDYEDSEASYEEQKTCVSPAEYFQMKNTESNICISGNSGDIPNSTLHENYFHNTPNVRELEVRWLVNRVDKHAFSNLTKLNILILNMTRISDLPHEVFQGLPLTDIFIRKSDISVIQPGTFEHLPTLESLTITSSRLRHLTYNTVPHNNVTSLDYAYNQIEVIEPTAFNNINNLEYLFLTENKISAFDFEEYLKDNLQLKILDMGSNLLTTVNQINLPNLIELDLNANQITTIVPGAFKNCKKLEKLIVSYNKLKTFHTNLLPVNGLNKLKLFDISDNQIACIPRGTLDLFPNLLLVFWSDNPISCDCLHEIIIWMEKKKIPVSSSTTRNNPCGFNESNNSSKNSDTPKY
ncbi:slit [Carabus blaptoides fortunei]